MIFLCFSSIDRYTIVKSFLYHLKTYGFNVWYDYHELILGDEKKEKNFINAISKCNYFVIIYSQAFFKSACAITEENLIFSEYKKRNITVFPILYNIRYNELPRLQQERVENLIYNEISDQSGGLASINQIVCKCLIDDMHIPSNEPTPQINYSFANRIYDTYIKEIINSYLQVSSENFNARIALLYSLYKYCTVIKPIPIIPEYVNKIVNHLFNITKLNIPLNHKEIIIAELSIMKLFEINDLMLH